MIPSRLRPQMLQIIHQGHMGTEKCLLKAKESLFWPGISRDIKELTAQPTEKSDGLPLTTRSGRVVRKPSRLDL